MRTAIVLLLLASPLLSHARSIHSAQPLRLAAPQARVEAVDTPAGDTSHVKDSLTFEMSPLGWQFRRARSHYFVLDEISRGRQAPYRENFALMDFNRVTGFFLGLGTPAMMDVGPHDEIGLQFGAGYGFASKRWEYRGGGEFRLPLRTPSADSARMDPDSLFNKHHHVRMLPTIAVGGEIHNITSTDDSWRAGRIENALFAFFAREDFRDYYKLAGWDAYIAFRPFWNSELRIDWRHDHYESLPQNVFYGRWGGNKVLPPNPMVAEGTMNSLAITVQREHVSTRFHQAPNLFGDTVTYEQLQGTSSLIEAELGHMPASDFGFNRYLIDSRHFHPILNGLSFDTRFRYEVTVGDLLPQKAEYLGGPSSLPALYRKDLFGNRMLLLNTELRVSLVALSSIFHSPDMNLVIFNDFGKIGMATPDQSIVQGFNFNGISSILYNAGVGVGWTSGMQVGATWRTDIKEDPRWIFRLQRAF
jgi:hypothetical protein